MGINIIQPAELTRLAGSQIVGESNLQMLHQRETGSEVDTQVGILETILPNLSVIDFVAYGEAELRTSCQLDAGKASKADVVAKVDGNVQRLLGNLLIACSRC